MKNKILQIIVVLFCMTAAMICYNLLNKHISGAIGPAWFAAGCSDQAEPGGANCEAVLASPYSYFPPKMSDQPDGKMHWPVAFLGMVYYSVLLIWFIGVGKPSLQRRRLHWIPLLLVGIGLAGSVHYIRVMFSLINEWCTWCLVIHVLNLLIAVCVILMWPRARKVRKRVNATDIQPPAEVSSPHPSGRLLGMTLVAVAITMYGELNILGLKSWKNLAITHRDNYQQCVAVVDRFKKESEILLRKWQQAKPCEITIRPDDPIRSSAKEDRPTLTLVVFSDFECPLCSRFATFVDQKIQPMFDGQLRIVFKHYPIDQSCNPGTAKTVHPHACEAALMAEAVRLVGGHDAFWRAHDYLFAHRQALKQGRINPEQLAEMLQLDATALLKVMSSEEIIQRIHEDIEQAKTCAIHGTPAVFLENRLVDTLAITEITFWDHIADSYWKSTKIHRPEKTKLTSTGEYNPKPHGAESERNTPGDAPDASTQADRPRRE